MFQLNPSSSFLPVDFNLSDRSNTHPAPVRPLQQHSRSAVPSGKPLIVLVEDNAGDVFLVEEALREHRIDCQLLVCRDGEEAIQLFERFERDSNTPRPHLVLLDLNLPKIPGHKVLQWIRASTRSSAVPVVIVTSSSFPADLDRNQQFGATAYFRKPSSLTDFMKIGELVYSFLGRPDA